MRDQRDVGRPVGRIPVTISGPDVPDTAGYLVGVDAGTLYARSERQIAQASPIVISLDRVTLSGMVMESRPAEDEWIISIALPAGKRRLEERIPYGREGKIGIVENGKTDLRPCMILDASPHGLGIQLDFPVEIGAKICVEMESSVIFGEIRHSRVGSDGGYIAGILIVDVETDVKNQSAFTVMLNQLRWKIAAAIRGREAPVYRGEDRGV